MPPLFAVDSGRFCYVSARNRSADSLLSSLGEFVALDVVMSTSRQAQSWSGLAKGGKAHTTFVGAKSRREFNCYLRHRQGGPNDPLWVTARGHRLTYPGLKQIARPGAEKAGVPAPSLRSFRRGVRPMRSGRGTEEESLREAE